MGAIRLASLLACVLYSMEVVNPGIKEITYPTPNHVLSISFFLMLPSVILLYSECYKATQDFMRSSQFRSITRHGNLMYNHHTIINVTAVLCGVGRGCYCHASCGCAPYSYTGWSQRHIFRDYIPSNTMSLHFLIVVCVVAPSPLTFIHII